MGYPLKYNFPIQVQGDTFLGTTFQLFDGNDDPLDLTGCAAKMQIRRTAGNSVVLEWTTTDDSILISTNEIAMQPKPLYVTEYPYRYDLEVTYSDGRVLTIIYGIFPVQTDISR